MPLLSANNLRWSFESILTEMEILNLKQHPSCMCGLKVTAIWRGFFFLVELHWEWSETAACWLFNRPGVAGAVLQTPLSFIN